MKGPAQGIENYLCSIDFNQAVGNSFDAITKRSRKQAEKGLAYSLQVVFEKRKRLLSRLQRKSANINALMQSSLNVKTVNEEFNQYDDLLNLFLDTHYQYHSQLKDFQQIKDGNWFEKVYQESCIYIEGPRTIIFLLIEKQRKKEVERSKKQRKKEVERSSKEKKTDKERTAKQRNGKDLCVDIETLF